MSQHTLSPLALLSPLSMLSPVFPTGLLFPGYDCIDVTARKEFLHLATVDKARVHTTVRKHGDRPGEWDSVKQRAYIHSEAKETRDWEVEVYDNLRAH